MTFRWRTTVPPALLLALALGSNVHGQLPQWQPVAASSGAVNAWANRSDQMLRDGRFDIASIDGDEMVQGRTHERLEQRYQGLPVFGGELVRQMDGRTTVSIFGGMFNNVSVATIVPSIDAAAAQHAAAADVGSDGVAGDPELGILAKPSGYVLVYRMVVRSSWDIQTYFVNAITGTIEDHITRVHRQTGLSNVGTGVLNDKKKLSVHETSGGFEAIDLLRPTEQFTLDFHGSLARFNSFFQNGLVVASDVARSSSNTWTDGAVVDAHVYQGLVYDYYFKRFGRRSLDNRDIQIVGVVHPLARTDVTRYSPDVVNGFINNAAYLGDGFMLYGDGDGRLFDYLAGGLDVVGHELTHGVTDFSSQLEYHDESGALNEAFSDIMGTSIEFFFERAGQGPQKGPNFLIGEDVTRAAPGFVRSLQNPVSGGAPDHYSLRQFVGTRADNGGVHVNATIPGHAFYLAVAGGTNRVSGITVPGVGVANIERMERIFYRAFVQLMGPRSQFADARAATLQAATDLYGASSNERAQVQQAWTAVGVQ